MHRKQVAQLGKCLTATALAAGIWGCGGDNSSPATTQFVTPPTTTTVPVDVGIPPVRMACPANYKERNLSVNIITELQSLPLKNAHFDFSNRHFASINLCFGVAPEAIVDGNVYMLSETLELLALEWDTAPKKVETEFTKLENRKLVMRFPLAKVPAGTSSADMESKITIFRLNPEIKLLVAQERTSIEFDEKKGEGTVSVSPNESGRFVVAYKP